MTTEQTKKVIHTIDAADRSIGRVASAAAMMLMGKDSPRYQPHVAPDVEVHITNASKLLIPVKKKADKKYVRYTGHPGGLREENLGELMERRGVTVVLERAVRGMLPNNKLRTRMLKNLIVEE